MLCKNEICNFIVFVFACNFIRTESANNVLYIGKHFFTEISLDKPQTRSYAEAETFCEMRKMQIRAPTSDSRREILKRVQNEVSSISFYLPRRKLSADSCPVLEIHVQKNLSYTVSNSHGDCDSHRYFVCGPLQRLQKLNVDSLEESGTKKEGLKQIDPYSYYAKQEAKSPKTEKSKISKSDNEEIKTRDKIDDVRKPNEEERKEDDGTSEEEKEPGRKTTGEDSANNEDNPVTSTPEEDQGGSTTEVNESGGEIVNGTDWSGVRTASIVVAPFNAAILVLCLWAFYCTDITKSVRSTIQFHQCILLCIGQVFLIVTACQCSPVVVAQDHFAFSGAVSFIALEGVLLVHSSFTQEAPSLSLFYVVIGYSSALVFTVPSLTKLAKYHVRAGQLCILDIDSGAGWILLAPVIAMIVINITSVIVCELRIASLLENFGKLPDHCNSRKSSFRSIGIMTLFVGLSWIFGSLMQKAESAFSVLFLLTNIATPIAIFINHVVYDREVRAAVARTLGNRGKMSRRIADIVRPAPHKIEGANHRVTFHAPPKMSDTLRSTLERGIRPSIHLISPLDHIPAPSS